MSTADHAHHTRELALSGFTLIKDVIPPGEVAPVRDSVAATVAAVAGTNDQGVGFLSGILNHDQTAAPWLDHRVLMDTIGAALGDHVHVSFASAIINTTRNPRGGWHADWPFNQRNAGHVPAPYPDSVMHLTTLWMLSPFSPATGGTLVVPGSHRHPDNPTGDNGFDPMAPVPGEVNACGDAGDVLLFDSRLWHATASNTTDESRVALAVRYAPWWLDVSVLHGGSAKRTQMVDEPGVRENLVPLLRRDVYEDLSPTVQQLMRHAVEPTGT